MLEFSYLYVLQCLIKTSICSQVSEASRREAPPNVLKPKRDTDPTSESDHESGKESNKKVVKRSKIPTYHRTTLSTRCHSNHPKSKVTNRYVRVCHIKEKIIKLNIVRENVVCPEIFYESGRLNKLVSC